MSRRLTLGTPLKHRVLGIADRFRLVFTTLAIALCVLSGTRSASADAGQVSVLEFEGSKPQGVREKVVELLAGAGYDVMPEGKNPDVDSDAADAEFATVALDSGCRGFVAGKTSLDKKYWTTTITVRSGDTGEVVGARSIKGTSYAKLLSALDDEFVDKLGGSLGRMKGPKSAEPEPPAAPPEALAEEEDEAAEEEAVSEEDEPEEDSEPEEEKSDEKQEYWGLSVALGPRFVNRDWALSDSLIGGNDGVIAPTHSAPLAGVRGALVVYPGAYFTNGFGAHIGLEGQVTQTFLGSTDVPSDDEPRKTTFKEYAVALRGRIPLEPLTLGLFAGWGRNDLILAGEKRVAAQPDVKYTFLRFGADGAFAVSDAIQIGARAAYVMPTSFGDDPRRDLQGRNWFPHTEGQGMNAELNFVYDFGGGLGIRLGGDATYYAMSFNPDVSELEEIADAGRPAPPIAGGATDLYLAGDLSLVYTHGP